MVTKAGKCGCGKTDDPAGAQKPGLAAAAEPDELIAPFPPAQATATAATPRRCAAAAPPPAPRCGEAKHSQPFRRTLSARIGGQGFCDGSHAKKCKCGKTADAKGLCDGSHAK